MNRAEIKDSILESGIVAIIRMPDAEKLIRIAESLFQGGIRAIEITLTTPHALKAIRQLTRRADNPILAGAGSVLDAEMVQHAVDAGAQYIVSPVFKPEIIRAAHACNVPCMPGCFTPTEMLNAFESGADIIKVFPADIAGPVFIRNVMAPMPYLPLMPTGGVTTDNAGEWIAAGACCVGVGSALLDKKAIAEDNFTQLIRDAEKLKSAVDRARNRIKQNK